MKALSMPSLAPVVMVTSVSGSIVLPKKGEYALAMACFSRGRPLVGLYWFWQRRRSAGASVVARDGLKRACNDPTYAFDTVQGILCGIEDEIWRVVAKETCSRLSHEPKFRKRDVSTLAHIHGRLFGRGRCCFIDYRPGG